MKNACPQHIAQELQTPLTAGGEHEKTVPLSNSPPGSGVTRRYLRNDDFNKALVSLA